MGERKEISNISNGAMGIKKKEAEVGINVLSGLNAVFYYNLFNYELLFQLLLEIVVSC